MKTLVACSQCAKLNRVPLDRAAQSHPICGHCKAVLPFHDGVQDLNGTGLANLVKTAETPIVVDFWAEWCGPCKAFAPVFKNAAKELGDKAIFAKLNTETDPAAGRAHQVRGIPTLIVFKNGAEVARQSGAMPLPVLKQFLAQWT